MNKRDQLITGAVGIFIIGAFLIGLANSIKAAPFWVITLSVLLLAVIDFYESCIKTMRK
ncbi:MAG: hypothetical protein AAGC83_08895 [Pseudomonadota bacterium]